MCCWIWFGNLIKNIRIYVHQGNWSSFLVYLLSFGIQVILALYNESVSVSSFPVSWSSLRIIGIVFFFKTWWIHQWMYSILTFLCWKILVPDLFRLCISSWFNFDQSDVSRNISISWRFFNLLKCKFSKCFLMILWILLVSVVIPPFSSISFFSFFFCGTGVLNSGLYTCKACTLTLEQYPYSPFSCLILLVWLLFLFLLSSFAEGLLILYIKEPTLYFIDYFYCSFDLNLFLPWSLLISMSIFWVWLVFVCPKAWGSMFSYLLEIFLIFFKI
jgi:hypothetical protein